MYTVNFNGYPIHDPRLADVGIFSSDASASLMVNGAGSVYLTLLPTHPNLDKIGGAGKLEVLSDDQILFRGRVRRKDEDFLGQATFTAEGDLAALNDSVQPAYNFPGDFADDPEYKGSKNVVAYLFGKMLERHNAQVEPSQRILPGTVTVSDPNNYLVRSMENPNYTWEAMCNAFWGSSLGGYAVVRYTAGGTYLDYLAEINVKNQQRVEFGKNMLDLTQYGDTTEACSAVYPIGAEGLTIESIPDGDYRGFKKSGNVLISQDAVEIYGGRITKIQTWEDVTLAENLVDKAADWLESQGSLSLTSITCQAIDLQTVDGEPAPLMVGRLTAVVSPPHGIDENFVLTEVALSISDPTATSVTFGKVKKTLSSEIVSSENQNAEVIEEIKTDIKGNLAYTKDEIKRVSTAIQDSEKIVLGVIEERVTAVSGEVQDLEDAVNAGLGELQSQIDGQIMTWFYNYVPTTENEPAVSWATMVEKDKHLGDVFYIVDNETQGGQAYRWAKVNNVYKWILIEDVEVAKALADAAKAQDTADGKRRVFVNTPTTPYDIGDLWAQGASGDLMRCNVERQTGSYVASDWSRATDYTNDDALNEFIAGDYKTTTTKLAELVTTTDSISARVEQTETTVTTVQNDLENLSIGGTNLLLDTDAPSLTKVAAEYNRVFTSMVISGDATGAIEPLYDSPCGTKNVVRVGIVNAGAGGVAGYRFYSATKENTLGVSFVPGEQYTLSCYARAVAGEPQINITIWGLTAWGWKEVTNEWTKFSLTFEATERFNTAATAWAVFRVKEDIVGTVEFTGFKLEKGNKATDWSPSPDEAQYAIDNLQIGARNLQLGTQYWDDTCVRLPGNAVIDGEEIIIPTNTYTELEKIQVKNGEVYTIGCDVKSDVAYDGNSFLVRFFNEAGTRLSYEWATGSIGTDWSRIVKTITISETESPLFLGIGLRSNSGVEGVDCTLTYRHMMVERGNRATDWAPASADVESQITTTSQETAELVLSKSSIWGEVTEVTERVKDVEGILETAEKNGILDLTAENLSIKFTEKLNNADGVHITGKNFDFNKKGLTIANEGFSMQNLLDEKGMEVTRDGEGILSATKDGVNAIDLTARQYLIVGENARFEDYGTGRTACFWIGG